MSIKHNNSIELKLVGIILIICLLNVNFHNKNHLTAKTTPNQKTDYSTNSFQRITEIGSWEQNLGDVDSIMIDGDLAYIGGGDCTLTILNISDVTKPELISTYNSGILHVSNIYLDDSVLFLSKTTSGFEVINVSDPYNPSEISYQSTYYISDLTISGDYLFCTSNYMDLRVFSIANLSNIELIASINYGTYGSYGIDLVDHYVYLANGLEGLKIYDIADPYNPQLVGRNDTITTNFLKITVQNNISYILDNNNTILTFDVSNVTNPTLLDLYHGIDYDNFFVEENYIYVMGKNIGLEILNETNHENITLVSAFPFSGNPTDIFVKEDHIFITDWTYCLMIIDITNKLSPLEITNFGNGVLEKSFIYDDYAFLIDTKVGLIILNITDPAHPRKIASYSNDTELTSVYVENNLAFISIKNNGFKILNITDITNPTVISHHYDGGSASDIYASPSRVYLADGLDGLEIYDISNVSAPVKIASSYFRTTTGITFSAQKLTIESGFAYVIDDEYGLFVIEIRDNEDIGLIHDFIYISQLYDCVVANGLCYAAKGSGINVYSIIDPDDIFYINSFYYSYAYDLKLFNQNFLVSSGNTGFRVIDIENGENLFILNSYDNLGIKVDIERYKNNLVLVNSIGAPDFQIISIDGDQDGLSDIDELLFYHTFPDFEDTDNDLLTDGEEILIYGTNPLNPDTDDDGLRDGFEIIETHTDPKNPDTDGDGYSDGYEYLHGSDPNDPKSVPFYQTWMVYVTIIAVTLVISSLLIVNILRRIRGKK
ncbi:MAG: hypothetical protein FK734_19815 [Asgard group archaeon]|nr:hypothetical protein [Asgard group archaeon]